MRQGYEGEFLPFDNRVLVKPDPEQDKTAAGLTLPESERSPLNSGTVVGVGPGRIVQGKRVPVECEPGDTVLYARKGGLPLTLNGAEYRLLTEGEIVGRLAGAGAQVEPLDEAGLRAKVEAAAIGPRAYAERE